jgi:hypothetical protein
MRKRILKLSVPIRLLVILFLICSTFGFLLFALRLVGCSAVFNQSEANHIVQEIQAGRLRPNDKGVVSLPWYMATVTTDGKVYVTEKENGTVFIFFSTRQKIMDFEGVLYSNRPIEKTDYRTDHGENPNRPPRIDIICTENGDRDPLYIIKQQSSHWYEVYYHWD